MPKNGYIEKELLTNKNWYFNFARARTAPVWVAEGGINVPPNFHNCREPPYEDGCQPGAMTRDRERGISLQHSNLCIGGKLYLIVCLFIPFSLLLFQNKFLKIGSTRR